MSPGTLSTNDSASTPSCARARGLALSTTMSARSRIRRSLLRPEPSPKSSATLAFPALRSAKKPGGPERAPSGRRVLSSFTTRAPASSRRWVQSGPAQSEERSTTSGALGSGSPDRPPASSDSAPGGSDGGRIHGDRRGEPEEPGARDDLGGGSKRHAAGHELPGLTDLTVAEPGGDRSQVVRPGQVDGDPAVRRLEDAAAAAGRNGSASTSDRRWPRVHRGVRARRGPMTSARLRPGGSHPPRRARRWPEGPVPGGAGRRRGR